MSEPMSEPMSQPTSQPMSQSTRIVISLLAGLIVGAIINATGNAAVREAATLFGLIGDLWLKGLQMTVIPLLISLLITGVAAARDTAATGKLAGQALLLFAAFLAGSALLSALLTPALLALWPVDPDAAAALRAGLQSSADIPPIPPLRDWVANIVPSNPFRAAADGAILPLVVFTMLFGLAAARLQSAQRAPLLNFFQAVVDTMLVVIQWVLKVATVGVFALALGVGMRGGIAAAGAITQYLILMCSLAVIITLALYPVAVLAGGIPLRRFTRAAAPAQAVAFSTQSSLASLPAMLTATQTALGIPPRIAGIVLPLAVSLFKVTSPGVNLAVVLFVGHVSGMELDAAHLALGAAVAILSSFGVAGIPGQVSFLTTAMPVAAAMGIPMELLLLLIAVEVIPDIFRTVGNVTGDIVVAAIMARRHPEETSDPET